MTEPPPHKMGELQKFAWAFITTVLILGLLARCSNRFGPVKQEVSEPPEAAPLPVVPLRYT